MAKFEAKFWGTKEKRGQLAKEVEIVEATTRGEVEGKLYARGWLKINGFKSKRSKE